MIPVDPNATQTLYAEGPGGVPVAYRVYGLEWADASRPPVLFVHGFAATGQVAWELTGWVRALRWTERAAIVVDLRGHGASGRPGDKQAYQPEVLAADLVAVLDAAGVGVVDVVSYSLGARVTSALVAAAPERVRRVVIGGAGPTELLKTIGIDRALARFRGDGTGPRPSASAILSELVTQNRVVAQVFGSAYVTAADVESLFACALGMVDSPLDLPADLPTLFVAGSLDPVPRGIADLALARGSTYLEVPGTDHVSTLASRVFKDAAIAFFAAEPAEPVEPVEESA